MKGFHLLVRALCVRSIKDTQCGFKLFTRDTARVLFNNLHVDRWYPLTSSYTPTPPYSLFKKIIFSFQGVRRRSVVSSGESGDSGRRESGDVAGNRWLEDHALL